MLRFLESPVVQHIILRRKRGTQGQLLLQAGPELSERLDQQRIDEVVEGSRVHGHHYLQRDRRAAGEG